MLAEWKDYVIGVLSLLLFVCGIGLYFQYSRIQSLNGELAKKQAVVTIQNAAVKNNEQNTTQVAKAEKIETQTEVVYRDRIRYIQTYKGDVNATNCENAIDMLRNYNYSGLLQ